MARYSLVLLALAVGCSASDPAVDRLSPGQRVVTIEAVVVKPPEGKEFLSSSPARKTPMLRPGERSEVLTDESKVEGSTRPVKVKVLTNAGYASGGRLAGEICTIERRYLRAIQQE